MVKLNNKQRRALCEQYKFHCQHVIIGADGNLAICWLKKTKERCEYTNWQTWSDCPQNCPHHLFMTKIECVPTECAIAKKFVKTIENILNDEN